MKEERFVIVETETGRLSCSKPNVGQAPTSLSGGLESGGLLMVLLNWDLVDVGGLERTR